MDRLLKDLGFTKQHTKAYVMYYGYLDNGACLELKFKVGCDYFDVRYISILNKSAKLTQFSLDVSLDFLKTYIEKLTCALNN